MCSKSDFQLLKRFSSVMAQVMAIVDEDSRHITNPVIVVPDIQTMRRVATNADEGSLLLYSEETRELWISRYDNLPEEEIWVEYAPGLLDLMKTVKKALVLGFAEAVAKQFPTMELNDIEFLVDNFPELSKRVVFFKECSFMICPEKGLHLKHSFWRSVRMFIKWSFSCEYDRSGR